MEQGQAKAHRLIANQNHTAITKLEDSLKGSPSDRGLAETRRILLAWMFIAKGNLGKSLLAMKFHEQTRFAVILLSAGS
jgi:hypothetical protein